MENQGGTDPQTAENPRPQHVGALLQVQEEGLHQIFDGRGTEVQNTFRETRAFRMLNFRHAPATKHCVYMCCFNR